MLSSITVAKRFIDIAEKDNGNTLTPMQLLKLVYIAHGTMLGKYSMPLINDKVEAWKYGPVIKPLYDAIKTYRNEPVTNFNHSLATKEELGQISEVENKIIKNMEKKTALHFQVLLIKKTPPGIIVGRQGITIFQTI